MLSSAAAPNSFTTTAHGYRNTVSTSNMRNKMAKFHLRVGSRSYQLGYHVSRNHQCNSRQQDGN